MKKEKICPEWTKSSAGYSLGTCKKTSDWLCEKSYAIKNYKICPFYNVERKENHGRKKD